MLRAETLGVDFGFPAAMVEVDRAVRKRRPWSSSSARSRSVPLGRARYTVYRCDDDVVVLVEYIERNVFALRRRVFGFGQGDLVGITRAHLALSVGNRCAVEQDGIVLDQGLDAAA